MESGDFPLANDHTQWNTDISGNAFFILAGQTGRLDVARISSFFRAQPSCSVDILKERLTRNQWLGILSALAIVLMTIYNLW